jgi:hypothetical protein
MEVLVVRTGALTLQLAEGNHNAALGGLAENCAVDGPNPQPSALVPGKTVEVRLHESCGAGRPVD